MRIDIIQHPDSLESIERNGQIVKVLGKGILKSPGHPAGNQQYSRQMEILFTTHPHLYPIFNIKGSVTSFLGYYKLLNYKIALSNEGFSYYIYTMKRMNYKRQSDEPSALQY